jgi:hypothetical protein
MKKLRPQKSMYASGSANRVRIDGSKKILSKTELQIEVDGILRMLAALVEENRGTLSVTLESLRKVGQEGRILQIIPGQLGITVKFKEDENGTRTGTEAEGSEVDSIRGEKFFESDAAREAREYLRSTRDSDVRTVSE